MDRRMHARQRWWRPRAKIIGSTTCETYYSYCDCSPIVDYKIFLKQIKRFIPVSRTFMIWSNLHSITCAFKRFIVEIYKKYLRMTYTFIKMWKCSSWIFRLSGLVDLRMYDDIVEYYTNPPNTDGSDGSGEIFLQLIHHTIIMLIFVDKT